MNGQGAFDIAHAYTMAFFLLQGGHGNPSEAAGMDPGKGVQGKRGVQGEAVVGNPMPDRDSDTAKFSVSYPNPWVERVSPRHHPEVGRRSDHRFLEAMDVIRNSQSGGAEIDDEVGDDLSRTVVGDIPAPFGTRAPLIRM